MLPGSCSGELLDLYILDYIPCTSKRKHLDESQGNFEAILGAPHCFVHCSCLQVYRRCQRVALSPSAVWCQFQQPVTCWFCNKLACALHSSTTLVPGASSREKVTKLIPTNIIFYAANPAMARRRMRGARCALGLCGAMWQPRTAKPRHLVKCLTLL